MERDCKIYSWDVAYELSCDINISIFEKNLLIFSFSFERHGPKHVTHYSQLPLDFNHRLVVKKTLGRLFPKQHNFKKIWSYERVREIIRNKESKFLDEIHNCVRSFAEEKIKRNPIAIKQIPYPDPDLQYLALILDHKTYWHIQNLMPEIVDDAVELVIDSKFSLMDEEEQLEFIRNYAWYIQYIKNPTVKQKIASLTKRPMNIQYNWFTLNDEIIDFLQDDLDFNALDVIDRCESLQIRAIQNQNFMSQLRAGSYRRWYYGKISGPLLVERFQPEIILDIHDNKGDRVPPEMQLAAILLNADIMKQLKFIHPEVHRKMDHVNLAGEMGLLDE